MRSERAGCSQSRDIKLALVAHPKRSKRRHVAVGAVASHCDVRRVRAEFVCTRRRPARRVQAIVNTGGEFVLGSQAVIDRGDDAAGAGTQISAHPVMRIEAAQDEAADVKEHEQRKRACAVWRVEAKAQPLA